jgi:sterol desaturase/sphingolipid hydroxylase (fatty acid hydroxylase superfamily)
MQKAIAWAFLPAAVLLTISSFLVTRHMGGSVAAMELAITLPTVTALLMAMWLERRMPHNPGWNTSRGDALTNWLSFGVLAGAVQPLLKVLLPLVVIALVGSTSPAAGLFPTDLPFALQVLLATLLAELANYWVHRLHHTVRHLWWLHALHHGSERLYSINNFRTHPVEYAAKTVLSLLPLMLLGAPADVMLGYVALTQPVLMLQHVNLPLRHGWLNYIFSTNTLHRWHHSTQPQEGNNNYGSALALWDQVFGTFYHPKDKTEPASVGLYAGSRYQSRASFAAQVLSMFSPKCCKA